MDDLKTTSRKLTANAVAALFALPSPIADIEPYGNGLINDTFLVTTAGTSGILQRINDAVFPQPERIMLNLAVLEAHLEGQAGGGLPLPRLIPSRDGQPFVRDQDGGLWRLMEFIPNTRVLPGIQDPGEAREAGRVLGRFHALTSALDPARLTVTLPGFHVTPGYLARLMRILEARPADHPAQVQQAISLVMARQGDAGVLEDARQRGQVPSRVIHGDPKLDNILFDRSTGRALCLIDLDTVQPGLAHYDLGDCLRSCCNRAGESATDTRARFDLDLCRAVLGGYADETRGVLEDAEIDLLYDAVRLLPFELGIRFLTDHLEGDRYFRVNAPGQNLRKARVQFSLVEDIERQELEIRRIVTECFHS
jgi:Ser/Thr protein kinase RdoA (MazF antagonist)